MDPFLKKVHDRPIDGKYTLVRQIGVGGFGAVFLGRDLSLNQEVALKLEHHSIDPSLLEGEASRYESFQGEKGFPRLYWFGWHDDFRVMAFELLGPSLADVFCYCERRLTLKTILMITDQLLVRLETLHAKGFVHRDIKPRNFLLGTGIHSNDIYMTDFGLVDNYMARHYDPGIESEAEISRWEHLVGTAGFASIRAHRGIVQFPGDDLESLGYMLIYFLHGKLPWHGQAAERGKKSNQEVMEMKMQMTPEQLCFGLPEEFCQYMQLVKTLERGEMPSYRKIRASFQNLAAREGLPYDHVYDWTIRNYLETEDEKRPIPGHVATVPTLDQD
ncbi:hypothetical protein AMS68_003895 [Peltaster fructicola]|uniref:non-specific serine/threonine protein kinase n=1 Tax=Peltaster fructicola TaxID=286661 RepID=A0A6H0XUT9_9PEZI|nr:hypothetical protein AMS68_003895 [Peltaster fructicola]